MQIKFRLISLALTAIILASPSEAASTSTQTASFRTVRQSSSYPNLEERQRRLGSLKRDANRLIRKPPRTLYNETAMACIATAVYHEARNQSIMGQKAVASVIIQRALTPERWGDKPCDVVVPVQFAFMTSRYRFPEINEKDAWKLAVRVALTVMYEGPIPELRGADHYHTTEISPDWSRRMPVVARIGDHIFYADPESRGLTYVSH